MAGIDNLKPQSNRTKSEQREIAKKGGIASGVSRRKKRDAKEAASVFLNLAAAGNLEGVLETLNINKCDRTNMMAIIARHVIKAQAGDEKSARLIFELSGDISKQNSDNNMNVNIGCGDDGVVIYLPEIEKEIDDG